MSDEKERAICDRYFLPTLGGCYILPHIPNILRLLLVSQPRYLGNWYVYTPMDGMI